MMGAGMFRMSRKITITTRATPGIREIARPRQTRGLGSPVVHHFDVDPCLNFDGTVGRSVLDGLHDLDGVGAGLPVDRKTIPALVLEPRGDLSFSTLSNDTAELAKAGSARRCGSNDKGRRRRLVELAPVCAAPQTCGSFAIKRPLGC